VKSAWFGQAVTLEEDTKISLECLKEEEELLRVI